MPWPGMVQTILYTASWLVLQHDNTISCCCSWKGRIKSVRQARQAYAKAMHVKPDRAAAWGDAASAFYVEAQLRRAHTSMRLEEGSTLTQASERCIRGRVATLPDALYLLMQASCKAVHTLSAAVSFLLCKRLKSTCQESAFPLRTHLCMIVKKLTSTNCTHSGGLRLDPADADLWACLGACASSDSVREYALGRALALDPKRAPCWAALGRLYAEAGHTGLADRCLIAARSHDPSSAAAWEAMGTLASFSAQGETHVERALVTKLRACCHYCSNQKGHRHSDLSWRPGFICSFRTA